MPKIDNQAPIVSFDDRATARFLDPLSVDPRRVTGTQTAPTDPASVRTGRSEIDADFRTLIVSGAAAPRAAEAAAKLLLDRYGPFSPSNSPANRAAIIRHLQWLASGSGIKYDDDRYPSTQMDTRPPNVTVSTRSGVCRDTHTATAAILGALMGARQEGGGWVLGSPNGHAHEVQAVGFYNPDELHAFMVYRDPGSGLWNALEYGSHYALGAATAVDAMQQITGHTTGLWRYRLRGWDQGPVMGDHVVTGAAEARDFFTQNPGVGTPGEVRLGAQASGLDASLHLTPSLALTGRWDPKRVTTGGVMLHHNQSFDHGPLYGRLHLGGGAYHETFRAGTRIEGVRAEASRGDYSQFVLGARADGRLGLRELPLVAEHLGLSVAADFDALAAVPLYEHLRPPRSDDPFDHRNLPTSTGRIGDYSSADVGVDARLSGRESVGRGASFDWSVWGRARYDLIMVGTEAVFSIASGELELGSSLLETPYSAGGSAGLSIAALGPVDVRIEGGGQTRLGDSFDPATSIASRHYGAVRLVEKRDGAFSLTALAAGGIGGSSLTPVDYVSVGAQVEPSKHLRLSFGVAGNPMDPRTHRVELGIRGEF